jgi:hypothetical protein
VTVDRFFRGIGNRFRGGQDNEAVDRQAAARVAAEDALTTETEAAPEPENVPVAASDTEDAAAGESAETPLTDAAATSPEDETGATSSGTDVEEDSSDSAGDDGAADDQSADDGSDTISFTDGGESIDWNNDSSSDGTTITITDGNDGSLIIENPGDVDDGSGAGLEPEPEPYPEPEPEPESDDSGQVGDGQDIDEVIAVDDATPDEADIADNIHPDRESEPESPGFISAAEAIRAGLITAEDLRVQPNIDFQGRFAGLVSSDDDDDDGPIPARQDDRIEIPNVDLQPEPGSGPPNLRSADVANLEAGPLLRSVDDIGLTRDGGESPGSTLPPVDEGATYSTFNTSSDLGEDDDQGEADEDQSSEHTEVVGIVDQDGNLVWHQDGWWASTGGSEGELIWRPGNSDSGPSLDDGVWDGGGYWAYLDDEVVWVAGPDGEGPPGDPPEYSPVHNSEDFGYGDPFDLSGSGSDDASGEPSPAAADQVDDEPDSAASDATTDSEDSSESGQDLVPGDYILIDYDEDGNLKVTESGTEGYWLFPGGPEGEPEWHGEGDPPGEPPDVSWVGPPEAYVSPDNDESQTDGSEDDATDHEAEVPPAFEPLPNYAIGDPISTVDQPTGINPADLRVNTSPDLNQYIDPNRIQQLVQDSEGDARAPDEIERPEIKLERAPGEGPPQVSSLDVMDAEESETHPAIDREAVQPFDDERVAKEGYLQTVVSAETSGQDDPVLTALGESATGEAGEVAPSASATVLDSTLDFKTDAGGQQPPQVAQVETAIPTFLEQPATLDTTSIEIEGQQLQKENIHSAQANDAADSGQDPGAGSEHDAETSAVWDILEDVTMDMPLLQDDPLQARLASIDDDDEDDISG